MTIEEKIVTYDKMKKEYEEGGVTFPKLREGYLIELWQRLVDECKDKTTGLLTEEGKAYLEMKRPFYEDAQDTADMVFTKLANGQERLNAFLEQQKDNSAEGNERA